MNLEIRRIYIDQEAKIALEEYKIHNGYNFTRTIWYLILHEQECKRQIREDKILEELKKKNQSRLDTFGREVLPNPETVQASKEEKIQ